MSEIVAERLEELSRLKERVDADLEAAELLSLTGAAIGPRYPKLLNAKKELDKTIPELEAMLKNVEVNTLVEGEPQRAPGGEMQLEGDDMEKRLEGIIPSSTLSHLRSLESAGVLTSPKSSAATDQSQLEPEGEMSPEAQAAAASFERVYGASKHPSYGAYGMVPDQRTRNVWGGIPVEGEEREE